LDETSDFRQHLTFFWQRTAPKVDQTAQTESTALRYTEAFECCIIDPSAAPPSVFRLARSKSGWRADLRRPKFGWRQRQTFPAAAAEFGASS